MSQPLDDLQEIVAKFAQLEADAKFAQELAEKEKKRNQDVKKQKEAAQAGLAAKQPVQQKDPNDLQYILERIKQSERDAKLAQELAQQEQKSHGEKKRQLEAVARQSHHAMAESEDAGYAYALSLFESEKTRTKRNQFQQHMDEDAALAAALQEEEHNAGSRSSRPSYAQIQARWKGKSQDERKKTEDELRALLDQPAVRGEYDADGTPILTDAHKYTSTLIRAGIPVLIGIDDRFRLSSIELSPKQVQEEVLAFLEKSRKEIEDSAKRNVDFLRISTDNIRTSFVHVEKNPAVEATETQANAHHLLSRTWTLAKSLGLNYMAAVATILSDNIGDQGHCIPGLIARLYAQYAVMIGTQLGVEGSPRPRPAAAKPA